MPEPAKADTAPQTPSPTVGKPAAYLGASAIVLANIAGVLSNVEEIRQTIFTWMDMSGLSAFLDLSRIVVVLSIEVALAIGAYWFYAYYVRDAKRARRIEFFIAYILLAVAAAFVSARTVSPAVPAQVITHEAGHLADRIWAQQLTSGPSAGGIQYTSTEVSEAQPWTTAQALVGILSSEGEVDQAKVRASLDYLERVRSPEGWGYFPTHPRGVTEINAWVTLANALSIGPRFANRLQPTATALSRIERDLTELSLRQHSDGCFGPIRGTNQLSQARAYSTVMALWAFVEAKGNSAIGSQPWWKYDNTINAATQCLLRNYRVNRAGAAGWWPALGATNPSGYYPGLTGHVLYVLHRAGDHFASINRDPRFEEAVSKFVRAAGGSGSGLASREISDNDRTHDMYRYLPGISDFQVESSTFLWYPWTLASLVEISEDNYHPDAVKRDAKRVLTKLISRSGELINSVSTDEALYPMAEALIAFGSFHRLGDGEHPTTDK